MLAAWTSSGGNALPMLFPLMSGLTVVLPILGHATWHLYCKVIEPTPQSARRDPEASSAQPATI